MRAALLAVNGLEAARLEELLASQPEAGVEVVGTVTAPGSVLAALDHDPHVYLLDMRWRHEALDAARLLQQLGVPLIICLFDRLDDPLLTEARALHLEAFHLGSPRAWLGRLREAG